MRQGNASGSRSGDRGQPDTGRRDFLRSILRLGLGAAAGGVAVRLGIGASREHTVWQLEPDLCVQCGNCSTHCVMTESAVKCVHAFEICGYCDLCSGYLRENADARDTAAEHRLCPTAAIRRTYVEDPYFEYRVEEPLCIACGRCVKACGDFGNGSLFLQVRHDRCLNCNQCSIARSCPVGAYRRVPASQPYLLKGSARTRIPPAPGQGAR